MTKKRAKTATPTTTLAETPPHMSVPQVQQPWSYSRRNVLEQCVRRYYYEYYALQVAKMRRDPQLETVKKLKALQNRYTRTGTIAHLVIATYLRKARASDVWKPERVVNWARTLFQVDLTYSARDPSGTCPPQTRFPVLLQEYFYQQADAADVCRAAEERLLTGLQTFVESVNFAEFRRFGSQPDADLERKISVKDPTFCISGKVDLTYCIDGVVTIVDWKLGDPSGDGDESLQLAAYALWAAEHFTVSPDRIRIYKAYLGADTVQQFSVNDRVLSAARARIQQDVERMSVAQDYGQRGIEEAFAPCAQPGSVQTLSFSSHVSRRECGFVCLKRIFASSDQGGIFISG